MIIVTTDTATACIFDPACLRHRKSDVGDWWSIPECELEEVNNGNALILNLGSDGTYHFNLIDQSIEGVQLQLKVPSGRLFVGPGEELTGGDLEPDDSWGGEFLDVEPGLYVCTLARKGNVVDVHLRQGGEGANRLIDLVRL